MQYFMALFVLQFQDTALHYASTGGHLPVVQALLDGGANVKAQNLVSVSSWSCTLMFCKLDLECEQLHLQCIVV